ARCAAPRFHAEPRYARAHGAPPNVGPQTVVQPGGRCPTLMVVGWRALPAGIVVNYGPLLAAAARDPWTADASGLRGWREWRLAFVALLDGTLRPRPDVLVRYKPARQQRRPHVH